MDNRKLRIGPIQFFAIVRVYWMRRSNSRVRKWFCNWAKPADRC
jgi:hypothetical protein